MSAPAGFTVLIPARMASSRLPDKPLADIAGLPMVVRVARRAAQSGALRTVVAADDERILAACREHGVEAIATRADHPSGSDRLAEACVLLGLDGDDVVVNVQGDEPLIDPALIQAVAALLAAHPDASMGTAAHAIDTVADLANPTIVKVVCDAAGRALYFSRAPIPWARDAFGERRDVLPAGLAMRRHVGLYAYRVGFLRRYTELAPSPLEHWEALEQLRALWHGYRIHVLELATAPAAGVDTAEDLERVRQLFRIKGV